MRATVGFCAVACMQRPVRVRERKSCTAAIVGGFNQVRGAIAGGFIIGIADNLTAVYISTQYRAAVPLLLLAVVIIFRPQGLLGRAEERTI